MNNAHVLGIGGSMRQGSLTRQALEIALRGAATVGAHTDLLDLRQFPLPLYDDRAEIDSYPENVSTLLDKVRWADGLILGTPVYHGILSGALKNALDFLELLWNEERPWLEGKVVGLMSVAGGQAGSNAINSMYFACQALHACVVPTTVAVPGTAFDEAGMLIEPALERRLLRLGREVAGYARLFAQESNTAHEYLA